MIKQKYGNGYWIGKTLFVCPKCLSLYHFIPFVFVLSLFFFTGLYIYGIQIPLLFLIELYGFFVLVNSLLSFRNKQSNFTTIALLYIFPLLHISYGLGTMVGILKVPFWKERKIANSYNK